MNQLHEVTRFVVFSIILIIGGVLSFQGEPAGFFFIGASTAALLIYASQLDIPDEDLELSYAVVKMMPDVEQIRFLDIDGNLVGKTKRNGKDQPVTIGIPLTRGPRIVEITYRELPATESEEV